MEAIGLHSGSRHAGAASPSPTLRAVAVLLPRVLALGWFLLIAYGSLVPFKLTARYQVNNGLEAADAVIRFVTAPRWWDDATLNRLNVLGNSDPYSDLWLNLLLYAPLGVLLAVEARARGRGFWRAAASSVLTVAVASWALECMQGLMEPERVAAINDVLTNTAGAAAGALAGPGLLTLARRAIFWLYCRTVTPVHAWRRKVRRYRGRPTMLVMVAMINLALIAGWFYISVGAGKMAGRRPINWLPFYQQFDRPYGDALEQISRSLIVYLLIGMLWTLNFVSWRQKRGLRVVVLLLAMLACTQEVLRMSVGRRADVTEPILAVMAVGFMAFIAYLVVLAIRKSCRRKASLPVSVDRRRMTHRYGLHAH
ncbi:MAG: VanZ family protein [Phycisphaeraceae bacterium]